MYSLWEHWAPTLALIEGFSHKKFKETLVHLEKILRSVYHVDMQAKLAILEMTF